MRSSKYILSALLLAGFVACDDSPSEPAAAQYDVKVTGAVTADLRGPAWFGADEDENGAPIFGIVLGQDTSKYTIILARDGAAAPGKGEYDIREPGSGGAGWDAILIVADGIGFGGLFVADSGRVTITESAAGRLRGTINLKAEGLLGEPGNGMAQVNIQGKFDARPAVVPAIGNARRQSAISF